MPTEKQRREAARRHLERQLQRRQEREVARKRFTLIASVVGTLVVIAIVVVAVVMLGSDDKKTPAAASPSPSTTAPTSPAAPSTSPAASPTKTYPAAKGAAVTFDGVTVKGAADTKGEPGVTVKATGTPTKLAYKDLVVGTGKAATDKSAVKAQYVGAIYKSGKIFQSSWQLGGPVPFTLGPGNVIDGFTDGIGGMKGVPPMKVGGRRIVVMPAALAYGASPPSGSNIPANSPLVFVVDLTGLGS